MIQHVEQTVVDLSRHRSNGRTELFQHNTLDEIPSLFSVNDITILKDNMDVVGDARRENPIFGLYIPTIYNLPQKASGLEQCVQMRPTMDRDARLVEVPLCYVDVEPGIRIVHGEACETRD